MFATACCSWKRQRHSQQYASSSLKVALHLCKRSAAHNATCCMSTASPWRAKMHHASRVVDLQKSRAPDRHSSGPCMHQGYCRFCRCILHDFGNGLKNLVSKLTSWRHLGKMSLHSEANHPTLSKLRTITEPRPSILDQFCLSAVSPLAVLVHVCWHSCSLQRCACKGTRLQAPGMPKSCRSPCELRPRCHGLGDGEFKSTQARRKQAE